MVLVIPKIIKCNRKRNKKLRGNFNRCHNKETAKTSFYCFRLWSLLVKLLKGIFYYLLRIFLHILLNISIIILARLNYRRFARIWLIFIGLLIIGIRRIRWRIRYIWRIIINSSVIEDGSATRLVAVVIRTATTISSIRTISDIWIF